jgi:hypothetical protein
MNDNMGKPRKPSLASMTPLPSSVGKPISFWRRVFGLGEPFQIKETTLILATSLFLALVHNTAFFTKVFMPACSSSSSR